MNYVLLLIVLCAAAFAAAWTLGLAAGRALRGFADRRRASSILFIAGILPLLSAAIAVTLVVAPAVLFYEPRDTRELPGSVLLAAAAVGFALLGRLGMRAVTMLAATRRIVTQWRAGADRLAAIDRLDTFAIDAPSPLVAIAGFRCPMLFIDRRIVTMCSDDEIQAIVAHELAHDRAGDNLKRLLLTATRGCRDAIVEQWRDAAERDADRTAAGGDPRRAVSLASALVKVARQTGAARLDALAISTMHDGGTIEGRVRALLSDAPARRPGGATWRLSVVAATALAAAPLLWHPMHAALEVVLHILP